MRRFLEKIRYHILSNESILSFLAGRDSKNALVVQVRLERLGVDVGWQFVGAVDFTCDCTVSVAARLMTSVDDEIVAVYFHLKHEQFTILYTFYCVFLLIYFRTLLKE
jgi:hypothetical protein